MKSNDLILLCALVFPLSGRADWIIVQNAELISATMHQTNRITLKYKGNRTRIDTGELSSTIKDNDSGDQIILMHAQKQYMVRSASQVKEGMEIVKQHLTSQADGESESIPKLQPTGKTEKISGYDAEEFVWEGKTAKGQCWVAKDFPNYAALYNAMESSSSDARTLASRAGHPLPDFKSLPGMVVRSERVSKMSTNVMNLVSAKEETLSDSEFTAPPDYKVLGSNPGPSANSAAGLRDALKAMEKKGMSEADRKKFEQIVNAAEAKSAKDGK